MLWLLALAGFGVAAVAASSASAGASKAPALPSLPLPDPGPKSTSYGDLDKKFRAVEEEGAAARAEQDRRAKEEARRLFDIGGPSTAWAGALAQGAYDVFVGISRFLYGDPGWNSPHAKALALERAEGLLRNFGVAPHAPAAGISDSWALWLDDLDRQTRAYEELARTHPGMWADWRALVSWAARNPDHPAVHSVRGMQAWPFPALSTPARIAGLGTLMAARANVDPEPVRRFLVRHYDQIRQTNRPLLFRDAEHWLLHNMFEASRYAIARVKAGQLP